MDSTAGSRGAGVPPQSSTSAPPDAIDKLRNWVSGWGKNPPPPPSSGGPEDEDPEEDGMARMSFLEHLEELRSRILRALAGMGVSFLLSLIYSEKLWTIIVQPAAKALKSLGYPEDLVFTSPMESFTIIWFKLPLLCSIFIASP